MNSEVDTEVRHPPFRVFRNMATSRRDTVLAGDGSNMLCGQPPLAPSAPMLPRLGRVLRPCFPFLRPPSNALCCSLRLEVLKMNSLRTRDSSRLRLEVLPRSSEISPSLVRSVLGVQTDETDDARTLFYIGQECCPFAEKRYSCRGSETRFRYAQQKTSKFWLLNARSVCDGELL